MLKRWGIMQQIVNKKIPPRVKTSPSSKRDIQLEKVKQATTS